MILSLTSLKVKNPFYLFRIWPHSFRAVIQLQRTSKCVAFKTIGFGNPSYTMTLWQNEKDMLDYFSSGAHAVAMREATKWAEEIRSLRLERDSLIDWKEAKELLSTQGKTKSAKSSGAPHKPFEDGAS